MRSTKSVFLSKINWTQTIAFFAMIATLFNFDIPAEKQAEIVGAIVALQGAVTIVLRTFFTTDRLNTTID